MATGHSYGSGQYTEGFQGESPKINSTTIFYTSNLVFTILQRIMNTPEDRSPSPTDNESESNVQNGE